jgi:hypothetical protein
MFQRSQQPKARGVSIGKCHCSRWCSPSSELPGDRFWQILLQKSFRGGERKFLEPLMRLARGDVRDHIASSKIDHRPP